MGPVNYFFVFIFFGTSFIFVGGALFGLLYCIWKTFKGDKTAKEILLGLGLALWFASFVVSVCYLDKVEQIWQSFFS